MMNLPKLLTPQQAADALGVSVATLAAWRHHGRYSLKFRKVGRLVRYAETDVAAFIEQHSKLTTA